MNVQTISGRQSNRGEQDPTNQGPSQEREVNEVECQATGPEGKAGNYPLSEVTARREEGWTNNSMSVRRKRVVTFHSGHKEAIIHNLITCLLDLLCPCIMATHPTTRGSLFRWYPTQDINTLLPTPILTWCSRCQWVILVCPCIQACSTHHSTSLTTGLHSLIQQAQLKHSQARVENLIERPLLNLHQTHCHRCHHALSATSPSVIKRWPWLKWTAKSWKRRGKMST